MLSESEINHWFFFHFTRKCHWNSECPCHRCAADEKQTDFKLWHFCFSSSSSQHCSFRIIIGRLFKFLLTD